MTIGIGVVIVILRAGDIGPLFVFGMHYQLWCKVKWMHGNSIYPGM